MNEIIKELEHLLNNFGEHCEEYEDGNCTHKSCSDCVLSHAIQIVKKHANDGWHVVADGDLPKTEIDVLVSFGDEYLFIAFYSKKAKVWKNSSTDTRIKTDVLAWQPLPQPYKGENNG